MFTINIFTKSNFVLALLALSVLLLARCTQTGSAEKKKAEKKAANAQYAGSAACANCHKAIYQQHLSSFHHLTSQVANDSTIKGSFTDPANKFYFNPLLYIAAEKTDSGLYQVAYKNEQPKVARHFDYAIGSGKRGQTFMYWYQQYLFQLPLTYFTATNEWTNSPGYSNNVTFNRSITSRCLECHTTYVKEITDASSKADAFDKQGMVLGVECEKCHGPASEHIKFHQQNTADTTPYAITNPAKFSRQQQLDLCRLCHGGRLSKTQSSFSFAAGDKLSDYFNLDSVNTDVKEMDVHGNQYGMLASSKCFMKSNMTCGSCHNAHQNEAKNLLAFADKCISCHAENTVHDCALTSKQAPAFLKTNCVNCHMPEQASKAIMVLRQGASIPTSAYMHTHFISIYKDVAEKVLHPAKYKD